VPRYVGPRLGSVASENGEGIEVEVTLETMPSVLVDAVAVPGGTAAVGALTQIGHAIEYLKDAYRHAKAILALGAGAELLKSAGVSPTLYSGQPDPGVLIDTAANADATLPRFVEAIARHRHHERETDPPSL
jgi:catalase